ncbi:DUF1573 domain-containing protein [Niabella sp. CJ426]|uniref:DUF1573 domain-containing protein n=1 Tax=Niabella sp. CJ426 TaxID=3393740 RepID=UPI003D093FD5
MRYNILKIGVPSFALVMMSLVSCVSNDKKDKPLVEVQPVADVAPVKEHRASIDTARLTSLIWDDSTYVELRPIKRGDSAQIKFSFTNTGNNPLLITGVNASCGCTVVDTTTIREAVLPGKKGVIRAIFHSEYQPAATHVKQLFVNANTSPHTGHILTFKLDVTEK